MRVVLLKHAVNAQTVANVPSAVAVMAAVAARATAAKVRPLKAVPKRVRMAATVNAVNAPPKDAPKAAGQNASHARSVRPASSHALKIATRAATKPAMTTPATPSRAMKA